MNQETSHTAEAGLVSSRWRWLAVARYAYARQPIGSSLAVALAVLFVDHLTGRTIRFPLVYAIPVGLAAWRQRRVVAYGLALSLPVLRLFFEEPWHVVTALPIDLANLPIAVLSLSLYAYLIERTSRQTKELQRRVRKLEGILHICAACKRIRNADGDYEQMESYITGHSEARFSHGLCPECLPKYLPPLPLPG